MRKYITTLMMLSLVGTGIAHAQCVQYTLSYAEYTSESVDNIGTSPGTGTVTIGGSEQSVQICHRWLAGGDCAQWITKYDTGSVSITVNGFTKSTTYNGGSTTSSIASALASAFNADGSSPVTASLNGSVVTLTAKATGEGTNYSLSTTSSTNDPTDFGSASFDATSASALTGGGAGTGGHILTSVLVDGSATMQVVPSPSCPGNSPAYQQALQAAQTATHTPSAYNVVNGVGGWGAGSSVCANCYLTYQNNEDSGFVAAGVDIPTSDGGDVNCSVGGTVYNTGTFGHTFSIRLSAYYFYGLSSGRCAWVPSCAGKCSSQHTTNTNQYGTCWTVGIYKQCFDLLKDGQCWDIRTFCYGKQYPGICTN